MNESPGNGATTGPAQPGLFDLIPMGRKEIGEQLRLAVRNREENPVWVRNRPGHWGRRGDWIYYGCLGAAWGGLVLGMFVCGLVKTNAAALLYTPALTLLQFCFPVVLIGSLDFLAGRRGVLEDLSLTKLTAADVTYGAYHSGVVLSGLILLPLALLELFLYLWVAPEADIVVMFFFFPMRWAIHGMVVQFTLDEVSKVREFDWTVLFRAGGRAFLRVALWYFLLIVVLWFLADAFLSFGFAGFLILLAIVYIFIAFFVGLWGIENGWRRAVENLGRASRGEAVGSGASDASGASLGLPGR